MVWLRTRRGEAARRSYKRIIDVEKEAIVLIVNALEAIGDVYGIYGFSGYGRENVEFYVIKEIDEPLTERPKRRLDKVAPLHATRMGPAIRGTGLAWPVRSRAEPGFSMSTPPSAVAKRLE